MKIKFNNPFSPGKFLIDERKRLGITQKQMANKLKITQASISRIEKTEWKNVPFLMLIDAFLVLGWKFDYMKSRNKNDI